jgi:tetratricopeptide (TPR) repeat protein
LAYDAVKENPDLRNYFGACAFLYARTLQGLDQHNEAIPYFEEALAVAAEFPLQVHYLAGLVHYHLANSYAALEKPDMEITCLESAFADFLTNLGPQDSGTQAVFKKLQDKYTASNKQPELDSLKLRMQATQDGP